MDRKLGGLIVASGLLISGCATIGPLTVTLANTFDPTEVAWAAGVGTAAVEGQAFFQTRGGVPRTCAGNEVTLIPNSAVASERMHHLYGSTLSGFRPVYGTRQVKFTPDDPAYYASTRKTVCDIEGKFEFENLPAGDYYVVTGAIWSLPGDYYPTQGGLLMRRVQVQPDTRTKVVLSR